MKVSFVYGAHENLGIEYLSSFLKKAGHETTLAFDPLLFNEVFFKLPWISDLVKYQKNLIEEVMDSKPDLVAFSVITETYQMASRIATEIKKRVDVPVIFGGVHPTLVPDRVIKNPVVDVLCIGEGESPLLELVNRFGEGGLEKAKNIPNLWVKCNGEVYKNPIGMLIQNLDELPFADKSLYYKNVPCFENEYTIMASRGCPNNCTFCTTSSFRSIYRGKGKYLRVRSVENVLQELVEAKRKYNIKHVCFYDDMFTFNKKWIINFCHRYKKQIDMPFKCIIHPTRADKDILAALKNAGCINMEVGVQSMDEESRRETLNRRESNTRLKKGLRLIKESGIDFYLDHILGIPYEDESHHLEAVKYYNELRPNLVDVFWLTHYPKTKITEISKSAGLLSDQTIDKIEEGLGSSIKQDGTVESPKKYIPFQYLMGYLPLLPPKFVKLIIRKKWYRFFTHPSILLSTILPRVINSFFWNDFRIRRLLYLHVYFFIWVIKRKFRK